MWQYLTPHVLTVRIRTDLATSAAVAPACEIRCTIALLSLLRLASFPPVSALLSACAPPVPLPLLGLVPPGPPGPPAPVPALALPHTRLRPASKGKQPRAGCRIFFSSFSLSPSTKGLRQLLPLIP